MYCPCEKDSAKLPDLGVTLFEDIALAMVGAAAASLTLFIVQALPRRLSMEELQQSLGRRPPLPPIGCWREAAGLVPSFGE
eukprot:CAMPEP_0115332230 /NCGR_PEP_ID=MMETSP0270-20121206/86732_1 /TAXON_ID=71861 /ORGANISM="Scrippsiella trochoidea, Strain CCMP3099" /LENGTH=80 /DNA_ID=CAMNT_0002753063 /DNA_START=277 /DNA_END=519 /DNA_ORIENTATION=-